MARRLSISEEEQIVEFMTQHLHASDRYVAKHFKRSRPVVASLRRRYNVDRALLDSAVEYSPPPLASHSQPDRCPGYVYLLFSENLQLHKIGFAKDPIDRVRALNSQHKADWRVVGSVFTLDMVDLEAILHHIFSAKRVVSNREWFALDETDTSLFLRLGSDQEGV